MPLRYFEEPGPRLGMIRDEASWLLPPGAVYDSLNMVYDKPGIARMRMGTTNLVTGAQTAFCSVAGFCYSQDGTPIEELYGIDTKNKQLMSINKTTGASAFIRALVGTANFVPGRPVRHFGWVFFPWTDAVGFRSSIGLAGETVTTVFTSTAVSQIAAGVQQITLTGADTTTNVKVGANVSANVNPTYRGRVISIDSATKFTVWPTPTFTNAAIAIGALQTFPGTLSGLGAGACAASFQNRLLFGNTSDFVTLSTVYDRRIYYSPLPTEDGIDSTGVIVEKGAVFVDTSFWPKLNFIEVSGADPIVALEPISDNQLLILTSTHPVVFSGNLVTYTGTPGVTSPTITFDLSDINVNAGCLSDLSVQRTPRGIVWAGHGDIYAWNGRAPESLTDGTISTYWRGLVRGSNFAIHGSAYVRGQYLISGSSGGSTFALMGDMTSKTPKWTRASGAGTDIFFGVARPTDPSQVFVTRWWDQSGAAPSMTNGQTMRIESMLNPYTPNTTNLDGDNNTINIALTTRTITGDPETQKLFQRGTIRYAAAQSAGAGSIPVTAQSVLDSADITAASVRSLGSLSNTEVRTLSNATNANPIQCTTTTNHGLQTDDFVDIDGVLGNLNANGRWRINRIDQTNFTLIGGIGSGAYTSGGSVKKLTETDYTISTLNAGQGVSFNISGTPNNFELHGVRVAALVKDPVMSS